MGTVSPQEREILLVLRQMARRPTITPNNIQVSASGIAPITV
jgi:hypothetical protein